MHIVNPERPELTAHSKRMILGQIAVIVMRLTTSRLKIDLHGHVQPNLGVIEA